MHRTPGVVPPNPDPLNISPEPYRDALGRPAGTVYHDSLGHRREVTAPQFTADDGTVTYGHEVEAASAEHHAKIEHMRANRTPEQREAVARYYEHLNAELDRLTAPKRERDWNPGEAFDFSAEWHEASRSAIKLVSGFRGRRAGSRQRPRGAGRPRVRTAQRSSAASGDSGNDSDGSDEPEPPEGRLCEAPWCSHPVYDGATYCKTDHCKRARAAERQRKRRAQLAADWVLVERRQRDEDTRTAGYYVFARPATGKPDRQGRDGHNLSFLWRFGLMPGRDPGEREAIPLRLLCQCNGHHIDGGEVGCVKCGKHRGRVYGYGPLGGGRMSLAIPLPPELVDEIARKVADLIGDQRAPTPNYLTPAEAADYLRCKPQRVYDLTSQGRLRARKDGSRSLYKRTDLDAYLAGEATP